MRAASLVASSSRCCSPPARGAAPRESFYMLSGAAGAGQPAPRAARARGRRSPCPRPWTAPPMVIRTGPNQVDIDDAHRWAEPLKAAIPRVLAENLRRELGYADVCSSRAG